MPIRSRNTMMRLAVASACCWLAMPAHAQQAAEGGAQGPAAEAPAAA
ncbi:hypothetical protein GTP91_32570, partial [Rugamonas sp. FT82W]|nr:hypothetical protein [Duganella vulcania]